MAQVRYAKPATTFAAQADQLIQRGMIGDRATMIARLSFVSYYRLSAYWWAFRKRGPTLFAPLDNFVEGTEFSVAWDHYAFDLDGVELMSLGNVTTMYQGCDDNVRDLVAAQFGVSNTVFGSWLLALLNVRNICAHHGRLWNRSLAKIPSLPPYKARPEWHQPPFSTSKVYAALTICNYLLRLEATR
jgi:abortive infection bacteriophage resistance protein